MSINGYNKDNKWHMSITYGGGEIMPGRDGSGPLGRGALTGRGLGPCSGADIAKYGAGFGIGLGLGYACRRSFGRGLWFGRGLGIGYGSAQTQYSSQKELLEKQKKILENRLEDIDRELEELSDN